MILSFRKICLFSILLLTVFAMNSVVYAQQKLPLPRMVSLRAAEVNVRTGPGVQYPVKWVFKAKNMPVEIIAEYDTWRKIKDFEGEEGWIHRAMLTGKRSLVITAAEATMHEDPNAGSPKVARLATGIIAVVDECNPDWCHANSQGYDGWIDRKAFWGFYPHEVLQ